MSKIDFSDVFYARLQELDGVVPNATNQKVALLLDVIVIGIKQSATDFAQLLEWELILIVVADRQNRYNSIN